LAAFNASGFVYLEPRDLGHVFWRRGWPLTFETRVTDGTNKRPTAARSELNIEPTGNRGREWEKYTRTIRPLAIAVDTAVVVLVAATAAFMFNRRRRSSRLSSFSLKELLLAAGLLALPLGYWQYLRLQQQESQDVVDRLSVHVLGLDHGLPEWIWRRLPAERIKLGDRITYLLVGGFADPEVDLRQIGRLTGLRSLSIGSSGRVGNIDAGVKYLRELKQLEVLQLGDAELSTVGLAELAAQPRLKVLGVSWSTHVTDAWLSQLATITRLEELTLRDCAQVTNTGLAHLAKLTRLKKLSLDGCRQLTDAGLGHLATLARLEDLSLSSCANVTDSGLAHLAKLTLLKRLTLHGCDRISSDGLAHLANLTQLEQLAISLTNQHSDDRLATLPPKEQQALTETLLTSWDTELAHFMSLPNLQHLTLEAHRITDRGLEILAEFPGLQTVVLRAVNVNDDANAKFRRARPDLDLTVVR
jgi:hypothetical protein